MRSNPAWAAQAGLSRNYTFIDCDAKQSKNSLLQIDIRQPISIRNIK